MSRSSKTALMLILLFAGTVQTASAAPKESLVKRIENDCAVPMDGPVDSIRSRQLADVLSMGADGRKALAKLASQKKSTSKSQHVVSDLRQCALGYLARLRDKNAPQISRRIAIDSSEENPFRVRAIEILGEFGDTASTDTLVALLRSDEFELALAAVDALGGVNDDRARLALRSALVDRGLLEKWNNSGHNNGTLFLAGLIYSIGSQHDVLAISALTDLAHSDAADKVRGALATTLARIGILTGSMRSSLDLCRAVTPDDKRRAILHGVLSELWKDYWSDDPRFSRSSPVEDAIREFEALF